MTWRFVLGGLAGFALLLAIRGLSAEKVAFALEERCLTRSALCLLRSTRGSIIN